MQEQRIAPNVTETGEHVSSFQTIPLLIAFSITNFAFIFTVQVKDTIGLLITIAVWITS